MQPAHRCNRHIDFITRLHKRAGIVPPFCFVKIDSRKMARIILQQWIDAKGITVAYGDRVKQWGDAWFD